MNPHLITLVFIYFFNLDTSETFPWHAACDMVSSQGALFPRCSLVVHHGGAGTAQDCILAETAQLIAPVLSWSDQPFWANEVENRTKRWDPVTGMGDGWSFEQLWLEEVPTKGRFTPFWNDENP